MKTRLLTTVAVIGVASAMSFHANAADIVEPVYAPPPPPVEVATSGWYLRGDVGYVFKSKTSGDYDFFNQPFPGIDNTEHYDKIELQDAASFGAGVGYRFTDYLRSDLTVDYFKSDVEGTSRCGYAVEIGYNLAPQDNDCSYDENSEADVWTVMANAYVDIGHYGRFTPYLGAGIGAAYVDYDDLKGKISCGGEACDAQGIFYSTQKGESSWRFASSLMAGTSVDITDNLKFDAGYRYTRIEGGDAFGFDEDDQSFGAGGVQGRDHGFNVHTIRAGLRYEFGGGGGFGKGKAPVYAEAPLYDDPAPMSDQPIVYK